MKGRVHAIWLLAVYFWRHWLLKATLLYNRGGLRQVQANYGPEGIFPARASERPLLPVFQSCTGCGLPPPTRIGFAEHPARGRHA